MIEDDVRAMLQRKATDVRVPAEGWARIQEKLLASPEPVRTRRARLLPLVAAAAAVAVIVAAVGIAAQRDDGTAVDSGPAAPATTTTLVPGPAILDAVWPSAVEQELQAISADYLRHQYPWAAASRYVAARLGIEIAEDGFEVVSGDATAAVLRVADGSIDAEIAMTRLGSTDAPLWYVERATSDLAVVRLATYDHERVTGEVVATAAGDLTIEVEPADASDPVISVPVGGVDAGDVVPFDERLPDESGVVVRAILRTDDAVGLTDVATPAPGTATSPPPAAGAAIVTEGVWPWSGDAVDPSVFDDPVATARAYVASRITDVGETVTSEFLAGDASSGEVEMTGDVVTTVQLRRNGDGWFVVGAVSDLMTVEVYDDGSVLVRTAVAGSFARSVRHPGDPSQQAMVGTPVEAGYETTASAEPGELVAHQLTLETGDALGWTEVLIDARA